MGGKTNILQNLILVLVSVILIISIFEVVFLLSENIDFYTGAGYTIDAEKDYWIVPKIRVHRESNMLGLSYEMNPNINTVWQGVNVTTNSYGIRDKEFEIPKPKNTYRVIGLGDSVTFGAGVELNETFLKVLEKKLNDQSKRKDSLVRYEVINGGVSAYNLVQKYIILESKLLDYQPDMVLVNFVQDDFSETNILKYSEDGSEGNQTITNKYELFSLNMPQMFPLPKKANRFLLRYSAFYRFINLRTYNILSKINPIKYPPEIYKLIGGGNFLEYNKEAIDKFYKLSQKYNFKVVIVSFPYLIDDNSINDKWILTYPSSRYNITTIDLYYHIKKKGVDFESIKLNPNGYAHLNEKGHEIVGKELYNLVYQMI